MRSLRTYAVLVVSAGLFLPPPAASACGIWRLSDVEKKREAVFYIGSVLTAKPGGRERPVALISHTGERRCSIGALHLRLVAGAYSARGRTHAVIDGDTVTVGKRRFQVEIVKAPSPPAREPLEWDVTVRSKEAEVARGQAMAFSPCSGDAPPEVKRRDILERVACYLVARDIRPGQLR